MRIRFLHSQLFAIVLLCVFLTANVSIAHDWWIRATPAYPEAGETVHLEIGGGHSFPDSESLLAARLLQQTSVSGADYEKELAFSPGDQAHSTSITFDKPGTYRVSFTVQRAGAGRPIMVGRTLLVVGGVDDSSEYKDGDGLEIIPLTPLLEWKDGGEIQVEVQWNGEVVPANIRVVRDQARTLRMRSAPDRPAAFSDWVSGPVLFIAEHRGTSATLVVMPKE